MAVDQIENYPLGRGALAVALVQPDASAARPLVVIRAEVLDPTTGAPAWSEVGRKQLAAPASVNEVGTRLVAVVAVPGALRYEVEATSSADDVAPLLQVGPYLAVVQPLVWVEQTVTPDPTDPGQFFDLTPAPGILGALAAMVLQNNASTDAPTVAVSAWVGDRLVEVDRRQLSTPAAAGTGNRLAAVVEVPGASSYRVTAWGADTPTPAGLVGSYQNVSGPLVWLVNGLVPSGGAQPDSYVWVGENGDDATGQRGNINLPFATIAAAIAAAQNLDTIKIAPGSYPGPGVVTLTGGKNLTLEGDSNATTTLTGGGSGAPVLSLTPGDPSAAPQSLTLKDLHLDGSGGGVSALVMTGPSNSNFMLLGLKCVRVKATGAVTLTRLARVELDSPDWSSAVTLVNVGGGVIQAPKFGSLTEIQFDGSTAQVFGRPRNPLVILGGELESLLLTGQVSVLFEGKPKLNQGFTANLTYFNGGGQDIAPIVRGAVFFGSKITPAAFALSLGAPAATAVADVDMSGSTVWASTFLVDGPAGVGAFYDVLLNNSEFPRDNSGVPYITVGSRINLYMMDSFVFRQDDHWQSTGGTIARNTTAVDSSGAMSAGNTVFVYDVPFPTGAIVTPAIIPQDAGLDAFYPAFSAGGFTVTLAAPTSNTTRFVVTMTGKA